MVAGFNGVEQVQDLARSNHSIVELAKMDAEMVEMLDFTEGPDGKTVIERKSNSITAKDNKCGDSPCSSHWSSCGGSSSSSTG